MRKLLIKFDNCTELRRWKLQVITGCNVGTGTADMNGVARESVHADVVAQFIGQTDPSLINQATTQTAVAAAFRAAHMHTQAKACDYQTA